MKKFEAFARTVCSVNIAIAFGLVVCICSQVAAQPLRSTPAKGESESCEVVEVSPTDATKVLISAKQGGKYPNPAQTKDGKIVVTARVTKATAGQKVYFEVIDPRDASPYNESQDPNDNRDEGKTGSQGYAAFQKSCLSSRQVQIGGPNTRQVGEDS